MNPQRRLPRRLAARSAAFSLAFGLLVAGAWLGAPRPALAAWQADFAITSVPGDGKGTVTSDDGNIDCRYDAGALSGDCSEHYVAPDFLPEVVLVVTLTASTGSEGCFDSSCEAQQGFVQHLGPGSNTVFPVKFNLLTYRILVNIDGPGAIATTGLVSACSSPPNGTDFCREAKYGTEVGLVPKLQAGYPFNFWQGAPCDGETSVCAFTMTGGVQLSAVFGRVQVTIRRAGSGSVCIPLQYEFCTLPSGAANTTLIQKGRALTVTATPAKGWTFGHWSSGPCAGKPATCGFTLGGPTDLTATFVRMATATPGSPATAGPSTAPTIATASDGPATPGASGGESSAPTDAPGPTTGAAPSATGAPIASTATVPAGTAGASGSVDPLVLAISALLIVGGVIVGVALSRRRPTGNR